MVCSSIDWSATGSMLSGIATVVAVLVAYFQLSKLSKQMRDTHDWNRRKTSQETLNMLVFGNFPSLRAVIESELGCKIPDRNETYEIKRAKLPDTDKVKLDNALREILNIFEAIAINIKHNMIDEDICYDYLGWIMVEYHRWSLPFIEARRRMANDSRILLVFSEFAEKWSTRISKEKQGTPTAAAVPAKQPL